MASSMATGSGMVPATSSAVRVTCRSSSSSSRSSMDTAAVADRSAKASAVLLQMVAATSPIRSTRPRLRADISAPRPRAARRAMCSARSPFRSRSGSIRSTATSSRRSSTVVSPSTSSRWASAAICPISMSTTSSRCTRTFAASRSPASSAWVAPAMASPTRANTCTNVRSISASTGEVDRGPGWASSPPVVGRNAGGPSSGPGPSSGGPATPAPPAGRRFDPLPTRNTISKTYRLQHRPAPKRHRLRPPQGPSPGVDTPPLYCGRHGSSPPETPAEGPVSWDPAMTAGLLIGLVVGVALGAVVGWLASGQRHARADADAKATSARLVDLQSSTAGLQGALDQARSDLSAAQAEQARLMTEVDHQQRVAAERAAAWEEDRQRLVGSFAELSDKALQRNAEQFLALADGRMKEAQAAAQGDLAQRQQAITHLLQPLQQTLSKYEQGLRQLELERKGAYATLTEQVRQLGSSNEKLRQETGNLVT